MLMNDPQPALGEVKNNVEKRRFELVAEGKLAIAEYIDRGSMIVFTHTEVPVGLEGRGIGSHLVSNALDFARREGKTIMPLCPYVAAYIRRHPEYQPFVLEGFPY